MTKKKLKKCVIKLKSLRFFLSTLLRQDNKLCCRTIYSEHSTLIEYNYASFQEQKAEKQSHNTIKGTEGDNIVQAGSLFSVPILQDNGIKMASFLSNPEIVPLYNF